MSVKLGVVHTDEDKSVNNTELYQHTTSCIKEKKFKASSADEFTWTNNFFHFVVVGVFASRYRTHAANMV